MKDISVIIVNYKVKDLILKLIESIRRTTKVSYEIIVVDNASGDNLAESLAGQTDVRLILNELNLGFAKAVNQGLKAASGRVLLVQNPDSEMIGDSLDRFVNYLDRHPDVHMVGPKIIGDDGKLQPSVRRDPTLLNQGLMLLKLHPFFSKATGRYLASDFDYEQEQEVEQIMGSSFAFRHELMDQVGLLDERFFVWFEEVDFMKRTRSAGCHIRYLPSIQIMHHGGQSFGQLMSVNRQKMYTESMAKYIDKYFGKFWGLVFRMLRPASIGLTYLQNWLGLSSAYKPVALDSTVIKTILRAFEFIAALEIGSFIAHSYFETADAIWLALVAAVFFSSLRRLLVGFAALFIELIVGSHGHMVELSLGSLGIRQGLFAAVLGAWFIQLFVESAKFGLRERIALAVKRGGAFRKWLFLYAAVVFGFVMARVSGITMAQAFSDGNAYVFALLALPALTLVVSRKELFAVFGAGISWLFLKTIAVFYVYSHFGPGILRATYVWIRDTRVGEITHIAGFIYRVFFASHLWLVPVILILMRTLYLRSKARGLTMLSLALVLATLMISLSRSLVLALTVGVGLLIIFTLQQERAWRNLGAMVAHSALSFLGAIVLLTAVANFPIPRPGGYQSLSNVLRERYGSIEDPAVGARWALLKPLWSDIKNRPLFGYGFGHEVSYVSPDPYYRNRNHGLVTSSAFEWGYLDLWTESGLIGLLLMGYFFWLFTRQLWRLPSKNESIVSLAILGSLLATHFFTPYLNHPIGLGMLMLLDVWTNGSRVRS